MKYDLKHLTGQLYFSRLDDFINKSEKPFYESAALKAVFDISGFSEITPLELYRYHFALFKMLYLLQDMYYKKDKYLHVHFMRSYLADYPAFGECREYDPVTGLFCKAETENGEKYCSFHKSKHENNDVELSSVKYFYFSDDNFYNIDENRAEAFVNGAWELLFNYEEYRKSIKKLDLPDNCTMEMLKTAYRKFAKIHHPDLNDGKLTDEFIEINDAYQLLLKILPSMNLK